MKNALPCRLQYNAANLCFFVFKILLLILLVALGNKVLAQNPGGITNHTLWYKADQGITIGATSTWLNLGSAGAAGNVTNPSPAGGNSGSGTVGLNAAASARAFNFNPTVQISGGFFVSTAYTRTMPLGNQNASLYAVGRSVNGKVGIIGFDNSATSYTIGIDLYDNSISFYKGNTVNKTHANNTIIPTLGAVSMTGPNVPYDAEAGNFPAGNYMANTNRQGTSVGNTSDQAYNNSFDDPLGIGGDARFGWASADAQIAEVVLYDNITHDVMQMLRVESYLASKYGLTLGNNSFLRNYESSPGTVFWTATSPYQNRITVIGRDDADPLDQRVSQSQEPESFPFNVKGIITMAAGNFAFPASGFTAQSPATQMANNNWIAFGDDDQSLVLDIQRPLHLVTTNWNINYRMQRVWRTQATGSSLPASVSLRIPISLFDGYHNPSILISTDATFGTISRSYPLTATDGAGNYIVTFPTFSSVTTEFFTLAGYKTNIDLRLREDGPPEPVTFTWGTPTQIDADLNTAGNQNTFSMTPVQPFGYTSLDAYDGGPIFNYEYPALLDLDNDLNLTANLPAGYYVKSFTAYDSVNNSILASSMNNILTLTSSAIKNSHGLITVSLYLVPGDLGDLPDTYKTLPTSNGAQHLLPYLSNSGLENPLQLGNTVDHEAVTSPSTAANNDDGSNGDENGISSFPVLTTGANSNYILPVSVNNRAHVTITITLDQYGDETSWEIRDASNVVVASGGPYEYYSQDSAFRRVRTANLYLEPGNYTYNMYDSYGDGLAGSGTANSSGYYYMEDYNGNIIFERKPANADFGVEANHNFTVQAPPAANIYGWIDFNNDGDFDANEITTANVPGNFSGNVDLVWTAPVITCDAALAAANFTTYARIRLTTDALTDNIGTGGIDERSFGQATNGEVEDYALTITGTDHGDLPAAFPDAAAYNLDTDNLNKIWLGALGDQPSSECNPYVSDNFENGLIIAGGNLVRGAANNFEILLTANSAITAYYGIWFDWDGNGTFDAVQTGSTALTGGANTGSVLVSQLVPTNASSQYAIRVIASSAPVTATDYSNTAIANGEVEDYMAPVPLPVELMSFTVRAEENDVRLVWSTASERNSSHFEIEYSSDGQSWIKAGTVMAQKNSITEYKYDFVHAGAASPGKTLFYRLKMVDESTLYKYSPIRMVQINNQGRLAFVTGNNRCIHINSSEPVQYKIFDAMGMLVSRGQANGNAAIPVHANGIYIVMVTNGTGAPQTTKLVL